MWFPGLYSRECLFLTGGPLYTEMKFMWCQQNPHPDGPKLKEFDQAGAATCLLQLEADKSQMSL